MRTAEKSAKTGGNQIFDTFFSSNLSLLAQKYIKKK
jgi:hypothetical protein